MTPGTPKECPVQQQPGWARRVSTLPHLMMFEHSVTQQPPGVWERLDSSSAPSFH